MMQRWMVLIAVMAGLAVLGAACDGGSEDGTATPTATAAPPTDTPLPPPPTATSPPPTVADVSDADLRRMVLTQEELGSRFAGFTLNDETPGFLENEDVIAGDCDPEEMRGLIERSGRVNGYEEGYADEEAVQRRTGAVSVITGVALFQDAEGAETFVTELEQGRREGGVPECFMILELEEFAPGSVGDTAVGLVTLLGDGDIQIYSTSVWFVRANVFAVVGIADFGDEDHRAEAGEMARRLDSRIEAVLRGESP